MSDSGPSRTVASAMSITNLIDSPSQDQPTAKSQLSHPRDSRIIWHYVMHVGLTPDFAMSSEASQHYRESLTLPVKATARVALYRRSTSKRFLMLNSLPILSRTFGRFFSQEGEHTTIFCTSEWQVHLNSQLDTALKEASRGKDFAVTVVNAEGWDYLASPASLGKEWELLRQNQAACVKNHPDWPTRQIWATFVYNDTRYLHLPTSAIGYVRRHTLNLDFRKPKKSTSSVGPSGGSA